MKTFLTLEDIEHARLPGNVIPVVHDLLANLIAEHTEHGYTFNPDEDGHIVLIEEGDTDEAVREAIGGRTLLDVVLEGCTLDRGFFIAVVLFNNQFGVSVVIEDAPWLDPAVRTRLMLDL